MAAKTSTTSKTSTTETPAGTGQEPDPRGVHIPGRAPGDLADHGPVTIPANPPRRT